MNRTEVWHISVFFVLLVFSACQATSEKRAATCAGNSAPNPQTGECECTDGWAGEDCLHCDGTNFAISTSGTQEICAGQGVNVTFTITFNSAFVSPPYYFSVDGQSPSNSTQFNLQSGPHGVVAYGTISSVFCVLPYNISSDVFEVTVSPSSNAVLSLSATLIYPPGCGASDQLSTYLNASGGVSPYTYTFENKTGRDLKDYYADFTATTLYIPYSYSVTDSAGCSVSGQIYAITIVPLYISQTIPNQANCPGPDAHDGSVSILAEGGRIGTGYLYSVNGSFYDKDNVKNGLPAGNNTAYVKDFNGCIATKNFNVPQPEQEVTISYEKDPLCTNPVTLTGGGGSGEKRFAIDDSSNFTTPPENKLYVSTGTHYFVVKDYFGCSASTTPEYFTALTVMTKTEPETCTSYGNVTFFVTYGSPPYTYAMTGTQSLVSTHNVTIPKEAGTYNFSVTDTKNCAFLGTFHIGYDGINPYAQGIHFPNTTGGIIGFSGTFQLPVSVFYRDPYTIATCTPFNTTYIECEVGPGTGTHYAEFKTPCGNVDAIWQYRPPELLFASPMFYKGSNVTITGSNFGLNGSVPVTVAVNNPQQNCNGCVCESYTTIFCSSCPGGPLNTLLPMYVTVDGLISSFYFYYGDFPVDPYDITITPHETWALVTWKGDNSSDLYKVTVMQGENITFHTNSSNFVERKINVTDLTPNITYTAQIQEHNVFGQSKVSVKNFTTLSTSNSSQPNGTIINCDVNNGGCDPRVTCVNGNCSVCPNGTYGDPQGKCSLHCGDNTCTASYGEDCVSCPYDCNFDQCDICGDLTCGPKESCSSCSRDCGACSSPKCDLDCSGNGICTEGHCVCNTNFVGPSCSLQNNQPIEVGVNQSNPSVTLSSQKIKFESSVVSISEVASNGRQIRFYEIAKLHFSLTNYTQGANIYNNYTSTLDSGAVLSVLITQIEQPTTINFAGVTTTYPQHTLKVSLSIANWPFTALSNTLAITFGSSAGASKVSCTKQSEDGDNNLRWIMVVVDNVALYGQFLDKAVIDTRIQRISYYLNEDKTVTAVLPHFWDTAGMDPDFSVLLSDPSATCGQSGKSDWKKIVAIVIPVVFVTFVAIALVIYFYPKIHRSMKVKKQRVPSSAPEIEIEQIKGYEVNSSAGKFNVQL